MSLSRKECNSNQNLDLRVSRKWSVDRIVKIGITGKDEY